MIEAKDMQASAQAALNFRLILDAFARPGTVVNLPDTIDEYAPLDGSTVAVALALCDFQTPIWLSPSLATPQAKSFLRFHTGAAIVSGLEDARFAFLKADEFLSVFPELDRGTDGYPDRSTTAIVQTENFAAPQRVRLAGPGIKEVLVVEVEGMTPQIWNLLANDRVLFPLGVDVAFASGSKLFAIPRSTQLTLLEDH